MKKLFFNLCTLSITLLIASNMHAAASSSQQSIPVSPVQASASLQELAINTLIAHPAQLAKDLPALHNENNPFFEQRYTIPSKSISDALVTAMSINPHILSGHEGEVNAVAYSPDGTIVASGGDDRSLRIWNAQTGKAMYISKERYKIFDVAFSPDGSILASGTFGAVDVWDPKTGEFLRSFKTLERGFGRFQKIAFSPDGILLATVIDSNRIALWDPKTGAFLGELSNTISNIQSIAFSPDSSTLAIGGSHGGSAIMLWRKTGAPLQIPFQDEINAVRGVTFNPKGTMLASGVDNYIQIRNPINGKLIQTLTVDESAGDFDFSYCLAFSPDGSMLAAGNFRKKIQLWDTATWHLKHTFETNDSVNTLAFSPDGTSLVSGSHDGTVALWSVDYQKDMETVTDSKEQQFLLNAAQDWLAHKPYRVVATHPIFKKIIARFPILNNRILFTVVATPLQQPAQTFRLTCSSSSSKGSL